MGNVDVVLIRYSFRYMLHLPLPSYYLFLPIIIFRVILGIRRTELIFIWCSIELSLMSIIPIIADTVKFKYFIVQSIGSCLFLIYAALSNDEKDRLWVILFLLSIALKLGLCPLHLWVYEIYLHSSWSIIFLVATIIKILPLFIAWQINEWFELICYDWWVYAGLASIVTGSFGAIGQSSLKGILAYSSISHTGWLIISRMCSYWLLWTYFLIYTLNTIIVLVYKNTIHLIALGGMPPRAGFFPKVCVIRHLIWWPEVCVLIILISILSLYYYIITWRKTLWTPSSIRLSSALFFILLSVVSGILFLL